MLLKEKDRLEQIIEIWLMKAFKDKKHFHKIRLELEDIAESTKDLRAIGYSKLFMMDKYIFHDGDLQLARKEVMDVMDCGVRSGDLLLEANAYLQSGNIYDIQGNTLVAYDQYWLGLKKAKAFPENTNAKENLIRHLYYEIAVCLMNGGEYEEALHNMDNLDTSKLEFNRAVILLANKVICYYNLNQYAKSWEMLTAWQKALHENEELDKVLYFSLIIWKYILLSIKGQQAEADALMPLILSYRFQATEAEELFYLCEYLLTTKYFIYFQQIYEKYEEQVKKLDSKKRMLELIKLWLRYLEAINDMDAYQKSCIQMCRLQQEVDDQEYEQKRSSLSKYISIIKKEEIQEELLKTRELLKRKSEYDELTDLPNRYKLNDFCEKAFAEAVKNGSRISVEILDIDFFKQFNDHYGHPEGDQCLIMMADQIKKNIAKSDLGARYGGDEFVIVRINRTNEEIMQSMERLRRAILKIAIPHEFSYAASVVTVSQGAMNEVPKEGDNWKDFLKIADEALYEAKKVSKNTVVMVSAR